MARIEITLPKQGESFQLKLPEPDKSVFDDLKEQYGFTSDAEAGRCFLKLGMMSVVDNDPRHSTTSQSGEEFSPVTIRQLLPEGAENAVDMTDEFWEQLLRDKMMDIVENDPEIKRDGFEIYR